MLLLITTKYKLLLKISVIALLTLGIKRLKGSRGCNNAAFSCCSDHFLMLALVAVMI